jgi:hypothetical protein
MMKKPQDPDAFIRVGERTAHAAFWLEDDAGIAPIWIDALEDIDHDNDKSRLVSLLRSKYPLSALASHCLADLLERYELKRKRGAQRTPAYDLSPADRKLMFARNAYRNERHKGKTPEQAVEATARELGLTAAVVRNFIAGRRGSSRRKR